MIVEIMQSHVETGKWYLQHQPTHPKGLMHSSPPIRDCRPTSATTIRSDSPIWTNGATRYRILPIRLSDIICATGARLYHRRTRRRLRLRHSNSTRHDSEAEQVEPKNFTVRAGGADNERTTRHACPKTSGCTLTKQPPVSFGSTREAPSSISVTIILGLTICE